MRFLVYFQLLVNKTKNITIKYLIKINFGQIKANNQIQRINMSNLNSLNSPNNKSRNL